MVGLAHLYQPARMMGGFDAVCTRPYRKKIDFCPTMEGRGGPSGRSFPPHAPHNSTWTCGGGSHPGVNLHLRRRAVNCGSSRNLPTGKCEATSGKSDGCGRPVSRKGNRSHVVLKPGMNEPESARSAKRLERERESTAGSEGTQGRGSITFLFSTGKVFILRPQWVCVFPVFPT